MTGRVLYVLICGAPPSRDVHELLTLAQDNDWDTCLLATPSALKWIDAAALSELTGHPVRSSYKSPGEEDVLPPPDAVIVAPATVNTINKWGAGICDTLPLGILVEGIGKKLPIVALPFTNLAQAAHPMFAENIRRLRSWGVTVLYGPGVYELHDPGTGGDHLDAFPWGLALDTVEQMAAPG